MRFLFSINFLETPFRGEQNPQKRRSSEATTNLSPGYSEGHKLITTNRFSPNGRVNPTKRGNKKSCQQIWLQRYFRGMGANIFGDEKTFTPPKKNNEQNGGGSTLKTTSTWICEPSVIGIDVWNIYGTYIYQ